MVYMKKTEILWVLSAILLLCCLSAGCNDSDSDANNTNKSEAAWYRDADGDGYGDPGATLTQKSLPVGYVSEAGDCADYSADIHPGAPELCDGKDNNCNGQVDENACEVLSQKISGRIANLNAAQPYITDDAYLQIVPYPSDGQVPFTTDGQGKKTYTSDLSTVDMPSGGIFVFETSGLLPGRYVIAAQQLLPYGNGNQERSILEAAENRPAFIVIPENTDTLFEIDLGDLVLPLPTPVDNNPDPSSLAPPDGVSASDGGFEDKIRVTWNASPGATAYEVYRADSFAGQQVKIATTAATAYDDKALPCGVDYYYWIKAKNAAASSELFFNDLGFIRCPPPADPPETDDDPDAEPENPVITEPENLTVPTSVSSSDGLYPEKVRIAWKAVEGATAYEIYRHSDCCGERTKIGATSSTFFDDTYDDRVSTAYASINYYWVKAVNSKTRSLYSAYDTGYKLHKPLSPINVAASNGTYLGKVRITWLPGKRPVPVETCGGGCGNPVLEEKVSEYEIYRAEWENGPKTLIGRTSALSFDDFDIPCSTCKYQYTYWVVAKNAAGSSPYSENDSGYAYETLPDPNDIRATDGTIHYCVKIRWSAVSGAKSYDIFRSDSENGVRTKIGSVPADCVVCGTYSYLDTTTVCPQVYYYWVKTVDSKGYSDCNFKFYDTGFCTGE